MTAHRPEPAPARRCGAGLEHPAPGHILQEGQLLVIGTDGEGIHEPGGRRRGGPRGAVGRRDQGRVLEVVGWADRDQQRLTRR